MMKFRVSGFRLQFAAVLGLCLSSFVLPAAADNADDVIARVLESVAKVKAADPEAVPMAF